MILEERVNLERLRKRIRITLHSGIKNTYYSIIKFAWVVLLFARNEQWDNAHSHIENISNIRFLVWGKLVYGYQRKGTVWLIALEVYIKFE